MTAAAKSLAALNFIIEQSMRPMNWQVHRNRRPIAAPQAFRRQPRHIAPSPQPARRPVAGYGVSCLTAKCRAVWQRGGRMLSAMPDIPPQPTQARAAPPPCRRCKGQLQYLAAVPERPDQPACDIFRCTQCAEVQWVERGEQRR